MTVIDTSAAVDVLLEDGAAREVAMLLEQEEVAAPDVLVFEVLAVLRRNALRGAIRPDRAAAAVRDLGDLGVELFPSLGLRTRAWELRGALTVTDALFVALAESLGEPLATKDRALAREAPKRASVEIIILADRS